MKAYSLTREERETVITKSEAESSWNVYTSSPAMMRRLDNWVKATEVGRMEGKIVSKTYEIPVKSVTIHKPQKVTDAMRQKALKMTLTRKLAREAEGKTVTP